MSRTATVTRKTRETNITVTLDLDGSGKADLHTGIGFFDHMLDGFARHGLFDLTLHCEGDLNVDCHHTIEDCGIALGTAIREALGDKAGIVRYGSCMLPMDETLALCAVDLGGRPYFAQPYTFTGDDKAVSKLKENLNMNVYATADNCMDKLKEDYDIDDSYTPEEQRLLAGIRYEMQLRVPLSPPIRVPHLPQNSLVVSR